MTVREIKQQVDTLRAAERSARDMEERIQVKVALMRLERVLVTAIVEEMGR